MCVCVCVCVFACVYVYVYVFRTLHSELRTLLTTINKIQTGKFSYNTIMFERRQCEVNDFLLIYLGHITFIYIVVTNSYTKYNISKYVDI